MYQPCVKLTIARRDAKLCLLGLAEMSKRKIRKIVKNLFSCKSIKVGNNLWKGHIYYYYLLFLPS